MLGPAPAHRLEGGLAGLALGDPFAGEAAVLDIVQDPLHLGLGLVGDDPGAAGIVAVFGRVRDRIAHVGEAALVDQVDDQLDLVQALEISHLGRVAGLDQGVVAGRDQRAEAAAEHDLLAEEVGLAFLAEGRLDDAGPAAADGRAIAEPDLRCVARGVLRHGQEAGHARAALIFRAHQMARALGRDHEDVEVLARLDQVEVDVEAVGESQCGAFAHVGGQMLAVKVGLQLVRGQDHDDVGPGRGLGRGHDLDAGLLGLLGAGRSGPQPDPDVGDAAVLKVVGMGVSLAAVADDGHLPALDQTDVGIAVVIDAHGCPSPLAVVFQ